jgi:hypothetical protein
MEQMKILQGFRHKRGLPKSQGEKNVLSFHLPLQTTIAYLPFPSIIRCSELSSLQAIIASLFAIFSA